MTNNESEPKGVIVTIGEIYREVNSTSNKIASLDTKITHVLSLKSEVDQNENRIRKLEVQNAAHWVVHSITIGAIAVAIGRIIENV